MLFLIYPMKTRMKRLFILLLSVMLAASCTKEVKQPSDDTLIALEAIDLVEKIRADYAEKDFKALRGHFTEQAFRLIERDGREFEGVELKFTPKWISLEADAVYADVEWEGKWSLKGVASEDKGTVRFRMEGSPLKVAGLLRDSPFKRESKGRGFELP